MTDSTQFHALSIDGRGIAVWRRLETRLAGEIGAGRIGDDGRLPTEAALARRFGVNRHTVRRAIAGLVERGLVRVERGRGMFVQDVVVDYPLTRRTSFSANLLAQGKAPASDAVSVKVIEASEQVAKALVCGIGAPVICRHAIGFADDVPIASGVTYFLKEGFPGLAEAFDHHESITAALEAVGQKDYRRLSTRILTRLPSPAEASDLRQAASQPVLVTEAIDCDPDGDPISFGITCFAGARVQISVEAS